MRVFVERLAAGQLVVRGDEHHYLSRVRRARPGDAVELVDGTGQRATAVIERIGEAESVLRAGAVEAIVEPPPRVRVLVPLIKGDRMDSCLEKLVEVGADELVIWPAARSVVKLDDARRESRIAHYQAIAGVPCGVVLDPGAERAAFPAADAISIISGPEGGFAPEELDALAGWSRIGLGPNILRADTAPIVAVALLRSRHGGA